VFREAHRLRGAALVLAAALGLALTGCGNDGNASDPDDPQDPPNPDGVAQPASSRARVKRKSPALLASDLGQSLDLARVDLCRELGSHDCFEAHDVLLGGVEPYELRVDEPLATPTVAAPMAVDRIVLSACGERVARDFAEPDAAVVFAEVAAGTPGDDARAAVAKRLYERLLARPARSSEIDALVAFHAELGAGAEARDWAQLACYAVATTTEFLFY
jgi:hypothetical protein